MKYERLSSASTWFGQKAGRTKPKLQKEEPGLQSGICDNLGRFALDLSLS